MHVRFFFVVLISSLFSANVNAQAKSPMSDIFFGEALFYAYQNEYFKAIRHLNTELGQYYLQDEPELDPFHYHINQAEFSIGDMELSYRMHQRAGNAIKAVLEGQVSEPVRNRAAYRLAKIYLHKNQPLNALHILEKMSADVPDDIRLKESLLRSQIYIITGKLSQAISLLKTIEDEPSLQGFAAYNLAVALMQNNQPAESLSQFEKIGQLSSSDEVQLSLKDKANLKLGYQYLESGDALKAKQYLQKVRLQGLFSNKALLGLGWVSVSLGQFDRALIPWRILHKRSETDELVQESMLAVPYAYSKLNIYGKAAIKYGEAMELFRREIDTLDASIKSIRKGDFLNALVSTKVQKNKDIMVNLGELYDAPETHYMLQLMASNDFQESLKNYSDLAELRIELNKWLHDLYAYEDIIVLRRQYFEPLLPQIQKQFKKLDARIKLRLDQRSRISKRLKSLLVSRQPEYLATMDERLALEKIDRIQIYLLSNPGLNNSQLTRRLKRLKGVMYWRLSTEYDQRLTIAYEHLKSLDESIVMMNEKYRSFIRTRQASTQSYTGYDLNIRRLRTRLTEDAQKISSLMARQGRQIESLAINELDRRRKRLEEYQIKARFALAESYDRANKQQQKTSTEAQQ